jgi:hypothetical protein
MTAPMSDGYDWTTAVFVSRWITPTDNHERLNNRARKGRQL